MALSYEELEEYSLTHVKRLYERGDVAEEDWGKFCSEWKLVLSCGCLHCQTRVKQGERDAQTAGDFS